MQLSSQQALPPWGKCLEKSIIYKATVKQENNQTNTYIGLTCNSFKKRFYSHNASFKNPDWNQKSLCNFVRKLQDKKIQHTISWEKIDQAKCFSPVSGICALCTKEKFHITFKPGVGPLNKKNEMFNNCRHKRRVLLCQKDQDLDQGWKLPTIIVFYLCWPHLQSSLWWLNMLRNYL